MGPLFRKLQSRDHEKGGRDFATGGECIQVLWPC
jgi:hypothetical protein